MLLYHLPAHSFFVELYYSPADNTILRLQAFTHAAPLEDYTPGSGSPATVVATAAASATALSYVDEISNLTSAYHYVLVTQTDGNRIVTSPIWYSRQVITVTQVFFSPTLALSVFPNPAPAEATVSYFLTTGTAVSATVHDALGRRMLTLADE